LQKLHYSFAKTNICQHVLEKHNENKLLKNRCKGQNFEALSPHQAKRRISMANDSDYLVLSGDKLELVKGMITRLVAICQKTSDRNGVGKSQTLQECGDIAGGLSHFFC
jgi:hypothetical protein